MLVEESLFGRIDKVADSIAWIRKFDGCDPQGYYLAFSGGKDSVCIYHLAKEAGVKFDAHYNLTTVDPPELVQFIRKEYPGVENHIPEKTMWRLIEEKRMPPTRIVRYCCEYLKERGGAGRFVITGVRAAESVKRSKRKIFEECRTMKGKKLLHPIFNWTDDDVWEYIRSRGLKYCKLYDQGHKRIGCVMCPMAGADGQKRHASAWPRIAMAYEKAMDRCVAKRIADGLPTEWRTGREMFEWWISKPAEKYDGAELSFD